jgi:hypothetical protein
MMNGVEKRYSICGACGRTSYELNEGDTCGVLDPFAFRRPMPTSEIAPTPKSLPRTGVDASIDDGDESAPRTTAHDEV